MAEELSATFEDADRVELLRTMVLIRTFEEAALDAAVRAARRLRPVGVTPETDTLLADLELTSGREPVAAGLCAHLESSDALTASHRQHHLAIAHGVDLRKLAVEALGGRSGLGPGVRHRWQLFDPDTHFTSSASIAEGYPPALGRAFAFQQRNTGRVAVAVTDTAAAEQDGLREALDLATLWLLPLVFVVEDDEWAGGVAGRTKAYVSPTATRTDYGVPSERVEDNAVEGIHEAVARAVGRARIGEGPSVVEVHTVRLSGRNEHGVPGLRADSAHVDGVDPVTTYERALLAAGVIDSSLAASIRADATNRVHTAIAYAEEQDDDADIDGHPAAFERRAAT